MRIAVLGAGAMGGTLAALLDRAGHDLEVTARGPGLAAIREHGIRLSGAWGEHTARVRAGEVLTRRPELAIVATKAMDAAAAVRTSAEHLHGTPVVVVQNGLGGLEAVAAELPGTPVIGALSLIAATYRSPGEVVVTTPAGTWLGVTSGDAGSAHAVASVLADAVPVTVVEGFAGARWTKLMINQLNALPAITGLSVQEVIDHDGLRRIMALSMREAARIALASDVRFEEVMGVTHSMLVGIGEGDAAHAETLPLLLRAYLGDVPNPGSTLQSIRRGQPSEIDYLNGAVVAAARELGLDAPLNARLTELVHEVERTGRFLSTTETLAALKC
ncbi:2-dehydropantoate 2-reductase [Salinibacterium sp. SYSU T00001]|uniref:ketopantoate reductase family protein n=1 Tax=Homoserinimonas sedimenticola TaxID=2986805 RepID=UPI002235D99D|nr:2-dehydropantoate 2-reductase [Salinibacterium sedimenticola]MCW4386713.1 2-dehydropantoate 2-reductase [Salinibacterium sedimenticola]